MEKCHNLASCLQASDDSKQKYFHLMNKCRYLTSSSSLFTNLHIKCNIWQIFSCRALNLNVVCENYLCKNLFLQDCRYLKYRYCRYLRSRYFPSAEELISLRSPIRYLPCYSPKWKQLESGNKLSHRTRRKWGR